MPPRLNKRQQREQDELELAQKTNVEVEEDSSTDEARVTKPAAGFAALFTPEDDGEDSVDEAARPAKSRKSKKKKSKAATPSVDSPAPPTPQRTTPQPKVELTKKAAKKAAAREKKAGRDELDQALAELAVKYPELQKVADAPVASSSTITSSNSLASLLSISLSHLDAEAEMKKFFGAKVVSANKTPATGQPNRRQAGGAQRSNLTRPQPSWWAAKAREGLTLRPLTEEELARKGSHVHGEKWWSVEYSKRYKSMTMAFMAIVMSGDPEGFWNLLAKLPWHADTLLQLSEVYRHREEYAAAVDYVDRALFTYERSFIGAFNFTSGSNRLDFDHVENRPFFLAVHRQLTDLQRRGCVRTAFEFARLLYSLDPWTDPHGALLHLDFLALKAGQASWLLELWNHFDAEAEHDGRVKPTALPGWLYSRALAMRMEETARKEKNHDASTSALRDAIIAFPSIAPLLADKVDIVLPQEIRNHSTMRLYTDASFLNNTESTLHLLSHLYAQRAFPVWKTPAVSAWLLRTITSVYTYFPTAIPKPRVRFNALYARETPRYSVYRHIMVLETSYRRLFSYIPQHIMNAKSLACDPLPPPTASTVYDDEFFKGTEDMFKQRRKTKKELAADERMLERMVPDPVFRGQLQAFFNAQPHFQDRFPGGILQFAQMAAQMPEDALEDMMIAGAMEGEGLALNNPNAGAGMPGQMPGNEEWVEDDDDDADEPVGDDVSGDDEEEEEIAPMPVRMLRNILGRFWGGYAPPPEDDSSEDDGQPEAPGRAPLDNRDEVIMTTLRGPSSKSYFLGNIKYIGDAADSGAVFEQYAAEYGAAYLLPGGVIGDKIVIHDPVSIAWYFSRAGEYPLDPVSQKSAENIFGRGLFTTSGEVHKRQRKALAPAFGVGAIRELTPVFFDVVHKLVVAWDDILERVEDETINIAKWMNRVSLDAIGIAGFGHDFKACGGEGEDVIGNIFDSVMDLGWLSVAMLAIGAFVPFADKVPTPYTRIIDTLWSTLGGIADTILERNAAEAKAVVDDSQVTDRSIIGLLVSAEANMSTPELRKELVAQMNGLLLAGYETTALTLTWVLIELARNPAAQKTLREELSQLPGDDLSWQQLNHSLPYLDAVIHEILRLHPAISDSTRLVNQDEIIPLSAPVETNDGSMVDRIHIKKGQGIWVPIEAVNRSTAFWGSDAKAFVPERWLAPIPDGLKANVLNSYKHLLSFIDGPRGCLGRTFVVAELKAIISVLVRTYTFVLPGGRETEFEKHVAMLVRPKVKGEPGYSVPMCIRRVV